MDDLVYRLRKRAEIRRQISTRKSVQEGKPDRVADLLEEAAQALEVTAHQSLAFKIYKPTPPRGAIPNVRDAELPWVYDQDPSSGNVASMWVTPVKATLQPQQAESITQITQDHYSNQNEPVAWVNWCAATGKRSVSFECESELASQPLYTNPQPCPTCEALSRTVLMDQTSHDKAQREWVGLTQEDIDIAFDDTQEGGGFNEFAQAIEKTLRRKNS